MKYIPFHNEHFFTKERFADYLREKLKENGGKTLPETDNDDLYDLYRQNVFAIFGLHIKEDIDKNGALADISNFFNVGKIIELNILEYLVIDDIDIPFLNGEISKTIGCFKVTSLKIESTQAEFITSQSYGLSFRYSIRKSANQKISPTLIFKSKTNTREYEASSNIDLSNKHNGIIGFIISGKDFLENEAGIYTLLCNGHELCEVSVPKIKLSLGKNEVQSFDDLLSSLNWKYQDWSLDGILIPFYNLVKFRILDVWLQDDGIKLKEQLDSWEANCHDITLNDLNQILILLGSETKINFYMGNYFDIDIVDFNANDCLYKRNKSYFFKWNSRDDVKILIKIKPKIDLNVNFSLGIKIGDSIINIKEPISFNLKKIIAKDYCKECRFNSSSFSNNKMGSYRIEVVNNDNKGNCKLTDYSVIVTGEPINVQLPKGEIIKMIGIYDAADFRSFYIAEKPISQRQLECLIRDNAPLELKTLLNKSCAYNGNNGNLPATFFSYSCCQKLIGILNSIDGNFTFKIPQWDELASASINGFYNTRAELGKFPVIQSVIENTTKFGVCNLFCDLYFQTSSIEVGFFVDKKILFGKAYNGCHNFADFKVAYKQSNFIEFENKTGFRPIMEERLIYNTGHSYSSDTSTFDVDEWRFNQIWNEPYP